MTAAKVPRIPIVITGIGVFTPIGTNPTALLESIKRGVSGIATITAFNTEHLKVRHAAEIREYDPLCYFAPEEADRTDRTAQFAILAARQALEDAGVADTELTSGTVGLVVGICAGGQGDHNTALHGELPWSSRRRAEVFNRTSQFAQTDALAQTLCLRGPRATVCTACASSGSALGYAYDLLQSGKMQVVIAGGADAFSLHTYAGFYALGAMAEAPCAPFSEEIGVTFGEGAGFVVLESMDRALQRGAKIYGELLGYGATGDGHHITAPHPTGEGLQRAIRQALDNAGLEVRDVDYINAHGTGTRDNDCAESHAIRGLFGNGGATIPPPVSSTKSFFGHTLGAAGVLEFITTLLCQNEGIIPPTLNFSAPRSGCDLDYVPNQARLGRIRYFVSNSAAFGGVNAVLVGGCANPARRRPERILDDVGITGIGIVSPIGHGVEAFLAGLREGRSGISQVKHADVEDFICRRAGLVSDFSPRRLAPRLDLRRVDRVSQFAAVAASLALKQAGLEGGTISKERTGVVVGLTHGPAETQEQFMLSLRENGLENLSAKYFPAMVVSTIGGRIAQYFGLKGMNSTVVEGTTSGIHALIHAFEYLRQNASVDALVVVGADEVGALYVKLFDQLGVLSGDGFGPYAPAAAGMVLGEGAAAVVLERFGSAARRGAAIRAAVRGYGLTSDPGGLRGVGAEGGELERAARLALAEAGLRPDEVDAIYGHGRGVAVHDAREVAAFERLVGRATPVGCVMGNTGVA
ncbi:MAG TPA: beta-ketoacyl-[acyl-carrier-protein] synthase family protein, partial [Gemmatimonadales bacterium]|nr:beta-ketoacyl-[acyl-carrier-protein] synthase family protein [Gemmatimonadales bacterium]